MSSSFRSQIVSLLECIGNSRGQWTWFAEPRFANSLPVSADALERLLYSSFFLTGGPSALDNRWPATEYQIDLTEHLSSLAESRTIRRDAQLEHQGQGRALLVPESVVIPIPDEPTEVKGRGVYTTTTTIGRQIPGFWVYSSQPSLSSGQIRRVYWNVDPAGVPSLTGSLIEDLAETSFPFQLKVLADARDYWRRDAAVLYIRETDIQELAPILLRAYMKAHSLMRDGVPALVFEALPGMGYAENPDTQSFGRHRCRLIAHAVSSRPRVSRSDWLEIVEGEFADQGIDVDKPYKSLGTNDYRQHRIALSSNSGRTRFDPERCLLELAHVMERQALRDSGRATWLTTEEHPHHGVTVQTMGPDLYGGTSGVGLFLCAAGQILGESSLTSLGQNALAKALDDVANRIASEHQFGFYAGASGVAWALKTAGQIIGDDQCSELAHSIVERLSRMTPSVEVDLVGGTAGYIALILGSDSSFGEHRPRAVRLAERLAESGTKTEAGTYWAISNTPYSSGLIGMAHGTSGVSMALAQVQSFDDHTLSTVDLDAIEDVVRSALAYEDFWYNPDRSNWPDFRAVPTSFRSRTARFPYQTAWCHGLPGVALSRMAMPPTFNGPVAPGLDPMREYLGKWRKQRLPALGLCHGAIGVAWILDILEESPLHAGALAEALDVVFTDNTLKEALFHSPPGVMNGSGGVGLALLAVCGVDLSSLLTAGLPRSA